MNQTQEQTDRIHGLGTQRNDSSTKVRVYSAAPCPSLRCHASSLESLAAISNKLYSEASL